MLAFFFGLGHAATPAPPAAAAIVTPVPQPTEPPNASALVDAGERSGGNDKPAARRIGDRIFARIEPAQVLRVTVNRIGNHRVCGLLISGVKFHAPLDRAGFRDEVVRLTGEAFAAAPIEEVDVTATVPLAIGKGVVVSGDLAMPTSRTVFTATTRRNESPSDFAARIDASRDVYWNGWFATSLAAKPRLTSHPR